MAGIHTFNPTRTKWVASAVVLAMLGAAWFVNQNDKPRSEVKPEAKEHSWWDNPAVLQKQPMSSQLAAASAERPLQQVRDSLFKKGSFRGTQADGDCLVDTNGQLKPDISLRHRFEYYLMGQGEVSIQEIRSLVAADACPGKSPEVVTQMLAIWDRYWQLRSHPMKHSVKVDDKATWMPTFDEARTLRRQILGVVWADAFFADEEAEFLAQVDRMDGKPPPSSEYGPVPQMAQGQDPAQLFDQRKQLYGEDAAQRLASADAEWAGWEKRYAAAKEEWAAVSQAPELSADARLARMNRYVQERFNSEEERRRVRALLDLPSGV